MRISFINFTNAINTINYSDSFISKIDKKIAFIAAALFVALGLCLFLVSMMRKNLTAKPNPDQLNGVGELPKDGKANPDVEKKNNRLLELQGAYPGAKILTDEDFQKAKKEKKIWIIIDKQVFDVTKFIGEHPGGEEVLLDRAGQDASKDFDEIGHTHDAQKLKSQYAIGVYGGTKVQRI